MMTNQRRVRAALMLTPLMMAFTLTPAAAQVNTSLSEKDRAEISALSTTYRRSLFECKAGEYADLFATPGGYFGSGARGEVRERAAIMAMVLSYDRCYPPPAPGTAEQRATTLLTAPVIEPAPEGAKARIVNSRGGGYYDDVYVKTPKGWRFKSRNVVSDSELAARVTTEDFIAIRQLAGDDHGHYEDMYGDHENPRPRDLEKGEGRHPFRSSGLRLTVTADGVRGLAYLRDNGGRYEDLYVKTPAGWRIKERVYVAPGAAR